MPTPILTRLSHASGPTAGGDIVRLTGTHLGPRVAVWFGGAEGTVLRVVSAEGTTLADVRTPPHAPALVDVVAWNLDREGLPVEGERATLPEAYRFLRTPLTTEADLTRVVRKLIQTLKQDVLENTAAAVTVDFQEPVDDESGSVAVTRFPSLVLSGPTLRENRFYGTNEPAQVVADGEFGPELVKRRTPLTTDILFTITGASTSTIELLNLMSATATFLTRRRWLELERDAADLGRGNVRWELRQESELRARAAGTEGVRAFSVNIALRGFDVEDGRPREVVPLVREPEVETAAMGVEALR